MEIEVEELSGDALEVNGLEVGVLKRDARELEELEAEDVNATGNVEALEDGEVGELEDEREEL